MSRNGFQDAARTALCGRIAGQLQQVRAQVANIQSTMEQLLAAQQTIVAGVATGAFDQADLDAINGLLASWTAVPTQPQSFQAAVAAFLASNIGA